MAFDLASISNEKRLRAPRIVLLGVEKIGKSTFASQSPSPVFIPIDKEEGIDDIDSDKFPVCYSSNNVLECLNSLANDNDKHKTVVLDSTSTLEPITIQEICQESNVNTLNKAHGGWGGGYQALADKWLQILSSFDILRNQKNMSCILIGHSKVARFDDPIKGSYSQWDFDIQDRVKNILYRWADLILFANNKIVINSEDVAPLKQHKMAIDMYAGQSFMYTKKRPSHPGGGRGIYGQLPYELPLNWNAFIDAVSKVA